MVDQKNELVHDAADYKDNAIGELFTLKVDKFETFVIFKTFYDLVAVCSLDMLLKIDEQDRGYYINNSAR